MKFIEIHLESFLLSLGFSSFIAHYLRLSILFILLIFLAWILFLLTKRLVIPMFYKLFKKTSFKWDDILAERDALRNLSHLTPAIVIKMGLPLLFNDFPRSEEHTSELQSRPHLVCRLLLEKKKKKKK